MHGFGLYRSKDGKEYKGEFSNGWMQGEGRKRWFDGRQYVGQWKKDMMWGNGLLTLPNGSLFKGQFRGNTLHGKGERRLPNGDQYIGQFIDGEPEGNGVLRESSSNQVFQGRWVQGRLHGEGKVVRASGFTYEGEWSNGVPNGRGRHSWTDGSYYDGPIKEDMAVGFGLKVFSDGSWFQGNFHDGDYEGNGLFHWADGNEFEGLWSRSKIAGPGCHRFPDGTSITGTFEDGRACGKGVKRWACGYEYSGILDNNCIGSYGTYRWSDGRCYVGYFKDAALHGEGTLVWYNDTGLCNYRGQFVKNAFHGVGKLKWANGRSYEGQFENGLYHGRGIFRWPDFGAIYDGTWVEGELSGEGALKCDQSSICTTSNVSYTYSGGFRDGHMQGTGTVEFEFENGSSSYVGKFTLSQFFGHGTYAWDSGAKLTGLFEDGFCNRNGHKVYPDGSEYFGNFRFDLEHGKGFLRRPCGTEMFALWKNGEVEHEICISCAPELDAFLATMLDFRNFGKTPSRSSRKELLAIIDEFGRPAFDLNLVVFLNGDRYIGMMKDGRKHGRGMYMYADNVTYKGLWNMDVLEGIAHPITEETMPVEIRRLNVPAAHANDAIVGHSG